MAAGGSLRLVRASMKLEQLLGVPPLFRVDGDKAPVGVSQGY
jgi:hypothetical protein